MPPLLLLTGSGRNVTVSSVSASQVSSVCGQINIELFLTLPVNFCWFFLTHRHNDTYAIFLYFLYGISYRNSPFLLQKKVEFKESILFFFLIAGCKYSKVCVALSSEISSEVPHNSTSELDSAGCFLFASCIFLFIYKKDFLFSS
jgi:hypothetical protein